MEVILTEDVPKLGNAGDVVKVRDGFGRNYLLPKKKALVANSENLKALALQKKTIEATKIKVKKEAEEVAVRLGSLEISIKKDVGSNDRLFGSVTKMEIIAALNKEGVRVDKHILELEAPIKTVGSHEIPVKLHPEVTVKFKLNVIRND
jgi:large subunit ribosomal protein L9